LKDQPKQALAHHAGVLAAMQAMASQGEDAVRSNLQYLVGNSGDSLIILEYLSATMPVSGICRGWLKDTGR
jgi:hypothetical protein